MFQDRDAHNQILRFRFDGAQHLWQVTFQRSNLWMSLQSSRKRDIREHRRTDVVENTLHASCGIAASNVGYTKLIEISNRAPDLMAREPDPQAIHHSQVPRTGGESHFPYWLIQGN